MDTDKRERTVYFGKFPDDTQGDAIQKRIGEWTNSSNEDSEEIYSIGLVGERGAAKFHSQDQMWAFMTAKKGKLQYETMGKTLFATLDSIHDAHPDKTKSIRKMVRAIVEKVGKTDEERRKVREEQMRGTSYSKGRVYFQGERVAEWDEGTGILVLKGSGKDFEEGYTKLMGRE